MKKIMKDKKGETLVEVLCAILIFTLASIILYYMVTSAARVNMKAQEHFTSLEEQLAVAEHGKAEASTPRADLTLTIKNSKGTQVGGSKIVTVNIFQQKEDGLSSYFQVPAAEGGSSH